MRLLAIDPGPVESAYVILKDGVVERFGKVANWAARELFASGLCVTNAVCERIRSYGMPAGAELFETCEWSGRFQECAWQQGITWDWLPRKDVKMHLCGSPKAKDANIRQALIDRFGGPAATKKGGALYKVSKDVWAALGVGVTYYDRVRLGLPVAG